MEPVLSSPFSNDIPQNLLRTGRYVSLGPQFHAIDWKDGLEYLVRVQ